MSDILSGSERMEIEPPPPSTTLTVETIHPDQPTTTETDDMNVPPHETTWSSIPTVACQSLSRKFEVDLPNIEITSLDMTPHGCFVLAGCSNGMVLLFDLTSSSKHGTLVGHIRAKGMHTNLILTVKITEDCRFAFAGCLKGSMEMLAVDMGQIPMWRQTPANKHSHVNTNLDNINMVGESLRSASHAPARVRTFNHLDPKLRGFGAVSRLRPLHEGVTDEKYVLICGKGIKSVHVWLFTPATDFTSDPTPVSALYKEGKLTDGVVSDSVDQVGGPVWTFLFDVATNGVTIEALGFRFWMPPVPDCDADGGALLPVMSSKKSDCEAGELSAGEENTSSDVSTPPMELSATPPKPLMLQMLSKSRGMCVRVWNLVDLDRDMSEENESDLGKLPYEDIPSSHDIRAFSDDGNLAFGGTYNFSVMRMDAPKWANREAYEVPARCTEDDSGQRRRRMMREINDVIACHDGNHVLALCTDGGVLYYHYDGASDTTNTVESAMPSTGFGNLIEFQTLSREVEVGPEFMTDDSWAIKRVGRAGSVVIIRAYKGLASKHEEGGGAIVDISLLGELAPETIASLNASTVESHMLLGGFLPRNQGLCYHDDSQSRDIDAVRVTPPTSYSETAGDRSACVGKPPSGRSLKKKHRVKDGDNDRDRDRDRDRDSGRRPDDDNILVQNSTPREKKPKIALSVSATPSGKYSTPAETVRGVVKPAHGSGGHRSGNICNISPQECMQTSISDGSSEGDANAISKRLYAPTPNAKKRSSSSKRPEDGSCSIDMVSVATDVTVAGGISSLVRKERKAARKRSLVLQVKYNQDSDDDDDDDEVGGRTKSTNSASTSTSTSACSRGSGHAGDDYRHESALDAAYAPPPPPDMIPHPGPAPRVKRVKIVPYLFPLTSSNSRSVAGPLEEAAPSSTLSSTTAAAAAAVDVEIVPPTSSQIKGTALTSPHPLIDMFQKTKELSWIPLTTSAFVAGIHLCDSTFLTMLGPNSRQSAETLLLEQDRLYQLFLIELLRGLESVVMQQASSTIENNSNSALLVSTPIVDTNEIISQCREFLASLFQRFRQHVTDVMQGQMLQMRCAMQKDSLLSGSDSAAAMRENHSVGLPPMPSTSMALSTSSGSSNEVTPSSQMTARGNGNATKQRKWSFVHCRMYVVAEGIFESVQKMVKSLSVELC